MEAGIIVEPGAFRREETKIESPRGEVVSFSARLDRSGEAAPVAHTQDLCQRPARQVPGPRRPRIRRCLLKDCERDFVPNDPLSRYCGRECSAEARRWSQREANRRYRASEGGRRCRREQACRYRQRLRERRACAEIAAAAGARAIRIPRPRKSLAVSGRAAMSNSRRRRVRPCRSSVPGCAVRRYGEC